MIFSILYHVIRLDGSFLTHEYDSANIFIVMFITKI